MIAEHNGLFLQGKKYCSQQIDHDILAKNFNSKKSINFNSLIVFIDSCNLRRGNGYTWIPSQPFIVIVTFHENIK